MFGISWGGFNGLQVAARRPPALKAVVTVCSTDDRYADDVHYMGGCVLGIDMPPWAADDARLQRRAARPGTSSASAGARCGCERLRGRRRRSIETVAHAPAARRLLAAGLGLRGLRRDRVPPSTRSAAGPTATATRSCGCSSGLRLPAQGPDRARGRTSTRPRAAAGPGDRLPAGVRCAGGTTGSRARTRGSWTSRCCAPGCRSRCRRADLRRRPGRWVGRARRGRRRASSCAPGAGRGRPGPGRPRRRGRLVPQPAARPASDAGDWCSVRRPGRPAARPAGRGRPLAVLRLGAADRAASSCSAARVALRWPATARPRLVAVRLCDVAPDGSSTLVTRGLLNLSHRDGDDARAPGRPAARSGCGCG